MTAIKIVNKGQEMKPAVRYQLQARPEITRLVIEFKESQHELLRQVMDLLVQMPGYQHKEEGNNAPKPAKEANEVETDRECVTSMAS